MVALIILAAAATAAVPVTSIDQRAPNPVVERLRTVSGHSTRVSLFDNRVAVVAARDSQDPPTIRRLRLSQTVYAAWLEILEQAYANVEPQIKSTTRSRDSSCRVVLYVGRGAPRIIDISPAGGVDLATGQVMDVLDAIEREVTSAPPWADQIRAWEPRIGDRVRLAAGPLATVIELPGDDVVIIEHDSTHVREVIPADVRERVVIEILERGH
jgi:hypothetical protein